MRIARVFPRRTKATPSDELAFVGAPGLFPPEVDEVHVSVTFTWDLPEAERLAREWRHVAPVRIGGPATGMRGEEFIPGRYLKSGYVITSRGCPNRCWFCSVPEREGRIVREYPVADGFNILDDNLLACSDSHVREVFSMLSRQQTRAEFTGGLEAAILKDWHVDLLAQLKPHQLFFAYDTPGDWDPLVIAAAKMIEADFTRQNLRCFVLIGYENDTIERAEKRLESVLNLGVFPMAMLFRDKNGKRDRQWMRFQKKWARPAAIYAAHNNKCNDNSHKVFDIQGM
jgi:hypothetical protein